MRTLNWTEKLLLLFTVVLGASLLFQLLYVLPYLRRREIEQAFANQQNVVAGLARTLDAQLDGVIQRVLKLAHSDDVRSGLLERQLQALALHVAVEPFLAGVTFFDQSGTSIASTGERALEAQVGRLPLPLSVPSGDRGIGIAPARFVGGTGDVICSITLRIAPASGDSVTVARVDLRLNSLISQVANYPLDMEQVVYVVEGSGRVLAHSSMDSLAPRAALLALDYGDLPLVRQSLAQKTERSAEYSLNGLPYLGNTCLLETAGWVAVAETPKQAVLAKTTRLAWQLVLIDVGLFTVALAVYWIATQQIVSERARTDEALWESGERFRTLFEESNDAVFIVDLDGAITDVNRTACRMLGCTKDELVHTSISSLHPKGNLPLAERALAAMGEGKAAIFESLLKKADGSLIDVEASARVTGIQDGMVQGVFRDITERKQIEDRMRQAEKMQAIGQLAGGIAHDFNNLLMGILGEANMLKLEAEAGSTVADAAAAIEEAAARAAELTSQLLGFARRGKHQVVPVDLHRTIHEAVGLLQRTLGEQVRIELDLRAQRSTVRGDPVQMQQVVMNLAINARDAMPKGGTLTLITTTMDVDSASLQSHPTLTPGEYLKVTVTDTGCGIPAEHVPRVFEPFFTTKEQGKGTGMGLATVYGIVENHGGSIAVDSEEEHGTRFTVLLPCAREQEIAKPDVEPPAPPPAIQEGKGHILLVDDEDIVLRSVNRMLTKLGYRATAVSSGAEAIALYEADGACIDLVIIDVGMPEMDGRECFQRIRQLDADAKILLSSGYDLDDEARSLAAEGVAGFVQKPYRMTELGDAVADVLYGDQPGSDSPN